MLHSALPAQMRSVYVPDQTEPGSGPDLALATVVLAFIDLAGGKLEEGTCLCEGVHECSKRKALTSGCCYQGINTSAQYPPQLALRGTARNTKEKQV